MWAHASVWHYMTTMFLCFDQRYILVLMNRRQIHVNISFHITQIKASLMVNIKRETLVTFPKTGKRSLEKAFLYIVNISPDRKLNLGLLCSRIQMEPKHIFRSSQLLMQYCRHSKGPADRE